MKNGHGIMILDPKDFNKCGNIWNMERQPNARRWYEEVINGSRITFIYTINGEFIGEGSLVPENDDPDYTITGKRIYLSRMAVKPPYRNQGIGSAIIDQLTVYAKGKGYREMSLGVNADNSAARHLYEKKGFTEVIFHGRDEYGEYFKLLKKL